MGFRFPIAAVLLVVISFVFAVIWAIMSFVIGTVSDLFLSHSGDLDAVGSAAFTSEVNTLALAFGVISLVLFIAGVLVFFFFDVFKKETDTIYYEE